MLNVKTLGDPHITRRNWQILVVVDQFLDLPENLGQL